MGKYFEAHEILEFQWKKEKDEMKLFLQALVQICIAMNKIWVKPNFKGAKSLASKALNKLNILHESPQTTPEGKKYITYLIVKLNSFLELFQDKHPDFTTYSPPLLKQIDFYR